jgi:hypothetical protein
MATGNGGRALQLPVGDLGVGRCADLIAVRCSGIKREGQVLPALFAEETKLVLAMVGGKALVSDSDHVLARGAR